MKNQKMMMALGVAVFVVVLYFVLKKKGTMENYKSVTSKKKKLATTLTALAAPPAPPTTSKGKSKSTASKKKKTVVQNVLEYVGISSDSTPPPTPTPTPAQAQASNFLNNFIKKSGVYSPNNDIEILDTTDINQCYDKCENNLNCGNFAFNGNRCYIKSILKDDAYTGISDEWNTYVRRSAPPTPTVQPPNLKNNSLLWQRPDYNVGDLYWHKNNNAPWNKYYKVSCKNETNNESDVKGPFGPVSWYNFAHPQIRLSDNNVAPCGDNKVTIYRSNSENGPYDDISDKITGYNRRDAVFMDNNMVQ